MLLSSRNLFDYQSVNSFYYADAAQWTAGDTVTLYFQLLDISKDRMEQGFSPAGRRYIPAGASTLKVTLTNINDATQISRMATQVAPTLDASIWSVSILASDVISGTCDLVLQLTQGGVVTTGRAVAAVAISPSGTP